MRLAAGCRHCSSPLEGSDETAACPLHGVSEPLWRVVEPSYEAFAEHLVRSRPLPSFLPWPPPPGWMVTDFGLIGRDGGQARAAFVTSSGRSDLDGVVDLTVLSEEPGVGLGARVGGVTHTDPGAEILLGAPALRVEVDGATVPLWPVPTEGGRPPRSPEDDDALDRAVLVGEVRGRWLWVVVRPAPATLLLRELPRLVDLAGLGPELVALPFGTAPQPW